MLNVICKLTFVLALTALAVGAGFATPARAQTSAAQATWVLTGSLHTARVNHTATLLPNGKVLVAGGSSGDGSAHNRAELYDPVSKTWSVTGSMMEPRAGHFAFLLPSGSVLVVGGDPPSFCCTTKITAELYDPSSGTWSLTGDPGPPVAFYAATMLDSGKVLVDAGGPGYVTSGWLYDPIQRTWNRTGDDPVDRQSPAATTLPGGKVLVDGGTSDADLVVVAPGAELYDPVTGVWTVAAGPNAPRDSATHTVLADGSVLIAGGFTSSGDKYSPLFHVEWLRSSEVYAPDGTWRSVGDLNEVRSGHTATLLPRRPRIGCGRRATVRYVAGQARHHGIV
jgi:hypothetical protein